MMRAPEFIVRWLQRVAVRTVSTRHPDDVIGEGDGPYLLRWHLFKRRKWLGNVYLHLFLRDDDDSALHDHPFPSLSIAIGGRMGELYAPCGSDPSDPRQHNFRLINKGDIVWRRATFAHRMELVDDTAWTVFIIGPKVREWGFACPGRGWIHHREFDVAGCD